MAHLLQNGGEGLSHHAPLSHSQSLAIARYLQDQIAQLGTSMQDLKEEQKEAASRAQELSNAIKATNSDVQALQDSLAGESTTAEASRRDLVRAQGSLQQLQAGFRQQDDEVAKLRDGQQLVLAGVQKLELGLQESGLLQQKLQEGLQRCTDVCLVQLRNELGRQELDIEKLQTDGKQAQAGLQEHKEALRDVEARIKGANDDLAVLQTRLGMEEQRLEQTAGSLKATQQDVRDVVGLASALKEDQERAREQLAELRGGLKKVGSRTRSVQEGLGRTARELQVATERLEAAVQKLDDVDRDVTDVHDALQRQGQAGESSRSALIRLEGEVKELRVATQQVRAGLKETSSLLLPNIHHDSAEARRASAQHGSLLGCSMDGFGGAFLGPSSPGRASPAGGLGRSGMEVTRRPNSRGESLGSTREE